MVSRRRVLIGGGALFASMPLSGCGYLPSSGGDFQFEEVVFTAAKPPGPDEYDPKQQNTYQRGEDVWVYLELGYPPTTEDGIAKLTFTFDIETPYGNTWEPVVSKKRWEDADGSILIFWQGLETSAEDELGEYQLSITVDDRVDGEQLSTAETFVLEKYSDDVGGN
ncbi:MAG: hypothetical protein ACI8VE_001094 [Natrialbaceae archaeon]|jgi:hypothetical protein